MYKYKQKTIRERMKIYVGPQSIERLQNDIDRRIYQYTRGNLWLAQQAQIKLRIYRYVTRFARQAV